MIYIPDFIYPKDPHGNPLCPKCKKLIKDCDCPSLDPVKPKQNKISPKVSLDKAGRMGKCVTLIKNLPSNESYLKDLAKTLKMKTGSGGTFYVADGFGVVEIQGDHKRVIEQFFKKPSSR